MKSRDLNNGFLCIQMKFYLCAGSIAAAFVSLPREHDPRTHRETCPFAAATPPSAAPNVGRQANGNRSKTRTKSHASTLHRQKRTKAKERKKKIREATT